MRETDSLRRFLFEEAPLRGHWVKLEDAWSQARAHQDHPPAVASLLGQALAASTLLAACLKFRGTLTLQVRSQGDVPLLIVQCTHDRQLRGVAQVREGAVITDDAGLAELAGRGTLVVTLDNHDGGEPWQGIVPLAGASFLAADDWRAGGLLLQKLPQTQSAGEGARGRMLEIWDECSLLLDTLGGRELLDTEPQLLLHRLFSAHDVRLFDADAVRFSCRCSQARVNSLLLSLGEDEVKEILDEQGSVAITCEFCNRQYRYDAIDAAQVFADAPAPDLPGSVN
ncbi:MAG: Hsp33 family molecular chaperone HslO [Proteobacteria bacterium]|nr:Hsp33 family molecular chaperone HslO [Pseudomonadota bacterium]